MTEQERKELAEQFKYVKPLGARIAVRKLPDPEQTKSGLYLPTKSVRPSIAGQVVGVGELDEPGVDVEVGDTVLLAVAGGTGSEIVFEETTLLIVPKCEVLAKATPLDRSEIVKVKPPSIIKPAGLN